MQYLVKHRHDCVSLVHTFPWYSGIVRTLFTVLGGEWSMDENDLKDKGQPQWYYSICSGFFEYLVVTEDLTVKQSQLMTQAIAVLFGKPLFYE